MTEIPIVGEKSVGKLVGDMKEGAAEIGVKITKQVNDFRDMTGFPPDQTMKAGDVVELLHTLGLVK